MTQLAATSRRDFLRGRPLAAAVREAASHAAEITGPDRAEAEFLTVSRRAMACQFQVILPATTPRGIDAATAALDEIDALEDQMTVYRDTSEVSRLNAVAATAPVPVEERLFELFETAQRLSLETDGAFDIAAGALIKAWGFLRGPKRVPARDELAAVMDRVGSRHVTLDRSRRTIAFNRPGLELNLGAIGKGYALDRAGELLRRDWRVSSAILHGGQSSVLAIGTPENQATTDAPAGWLVGVVHPFRPDEQIARLRLHDAALGTSGATIQYFEANGRRFGHILDPRSGRPAEGRACVSVIAPTAAEADALSTAFFILGANRTREFCDRRPEVGAIVVSTPHPANAECEVTLVGRANESVELDRNQALLNSELQRTANH